MAMISGIQTLKICLIILPEKTIEKIKCKWTKKERKKLCLVPLKDIALWKCNANIVKILGQHPLEHLKFVLFL